MATRSSKKTSTPTIRHPVRRRKQQVQGLDDQTLQAVKAAFADLQTSLDTYGHARTERIRGSLWADLYTGSGAFIGTLYYALPEQFLSKIGVLNVRVVPPPGGFFRSSGEDQPADPSVVSRGLSPDAGASVQEHNYQVARDRLSKVQGRGGAVHNGNGRGKYRSSKRGSRRNKVPPNR